MKINKGRFFMLEFEEYKVKLAGLAPELEKLRGSLGLEQAGREVEELEMKSAQPGFWDDPEASQKVVSRMGALKGKIEAYTKLCTQHEDLLALCEMALEENDDSMLEELTEGYRELEEGLETQRLSTLLTGEYDKNNALMSFHAGAGGTEAQDWCEMLYRMYTRWAERHGFSYKILDYQDGDEAGLKSADILIEGENAYGFLKGENGVHRLVRISPFDASGRRHTSFSAIEVIPEIEDTSEDFEIKPDDYEMQVFRSSGAGGQHINKTSSAIRLTHLPTGMVVTCQNERSQRQNKEKALQILKSRLYDQAMRESQSKEAADRKNQVGSGDRSERIRTYNFPQGRVTDHRINMSIYQLDDFMNGNMDAILDRLMEEDLARRMKEGEANGR